MCAFQFNSNSTTSSEDCKKSTSSARTFMEDEIDAFNKEDFICSFEFLKINIGKLSSSHNSAVLKKILDDEIQIGTGVPMFLLRIYSDLKYEVFHCGVKIVTKFHI